MWRQNLYLVTKRIVDVIGVLVAFTLFLPFWPIIALAIKLDSRGPIFFKQQRIGYRGKPFLMFKFRSMIDGADALRQNLLHLNETTGPVFKIRDDPRLTRVGAFLRKTSLDEVPQLINVLVGDMSLVGPRPLPADQVDLTLPEQQKRASVLPGLTCLWQINGRSHVNYEDWMRMDLEYIRQRTLWLDLKILIKTIPAVLSRKGAF